MMQIPYKRSFRIKLALSILLILVAGLIFLPGCSKDSGDNTASTGTVKGLITNIATGDHITGVTVKIENSETESDQEGHYEISNLPTGSKTITATKSGFQEYSDTISVSDTEITFKDIEMTASEAGGSVSGKVIDKQTGDPLEMVIISVGSNSTTSDSDGNYLLTGIPTGTQTIKASKSGFKTYTDTVIIESVRPSFKEIDMTPVADIGNIKGKVYDKNTGAALEGTIVSIGDASTTSDKEGHYGLTGITSGQQTLKAVRTGYSNFSITVEIKTGETILQDIDMAATSVNGAVAGFVTDKDSRLGLEDVVISIGTHKTTTDDDGKYILRGIPAGSYTITAQKAGYQDYSGSVEVKSGEITQHSIEMTANSTTGSVTGIVTDSSTGQTLENVYIFVGSVDAKSDDEGRYQLTGIESGSKTINAIKNGYDEYSGKVNILARQTVSHNIKLTPEPTIGNVQGTVTESLFGFRLSDVEVSIGSSETKTDNQGNYKLTGIAAGSQTIHAQVIGFQNYSGNVEVKAGDTVSHDIVMTPLPLTGTVKGTVTDKDTGEAIEKAWVIVGFKLARTDSNGNYTIHGIFSGNRRTYALKHAYNIYSGKVEVKAGETVFNDIEMERFTLKGTVQGRVTDSLYGTALEDVQVAIGLNKTETDSDGRYELTGVFMGTRIIRAQKSNYYYFFDTLQVNAGKIKNYDFTMEQEITTGEVQGTVTDSSDNSPLEDVKVELEGSETTTGSDGNYSFTGITAGKHKIHAQISGYNNYDGEVTITAGETTYHDFSMDPVKEYGFFYGIVLKKDTIKPVKGAKITVASSKTDSGRFGTFKIRGIEAGQHLATVQKNGYKDQSFNIDIKANRGTYKIVQLERETTTGDVVGTVTDESTGNPLPDVYVKIASAHAKTDDQGAYHISGVKQGDRIISATKCGYQAYSDTVSVTAGQTTTFNFKMKPLSTRGTVEGYVTDSEFNEPLMGVQVEVKGKGGGKTYTDENGYYKLGGIWSGNQKIQAKLTDYQVYNDFVTVEAGKTTTKNISMDPIPSRSTVYGKVTDKDTGEAIADATVSIGTRVVKTDSDGNYKIRHINPGKYTVTAEKSEYNVYTDSIKVNSGQDLEYNIQMDKLEQ